MTTKITIDTRTGGGAAEVRLITPGDSDGTRYVVGPNELQHFAMHGGCEVHVRNTASQDAQDAQAGQRTLLEPGTFEPKVPHTVEGLVDGEGSQP